MRDLRITQGERAKTYQRSAAALSRLAREAFDAGNLSKASWYQLEAAAEYRGARSIFAGVHGWDRFDLAAWEQLR